ncbi:pentapeptide repeat-containing protein [Streptomyces sp. NPDC055140]
MSDEQPTARRRPWWIWPAGITGTAAFIVLLIWGPWWIEGHHLKDRNCELVSSAGIIVTGFRTMLVAIAAGVFTAAGLWFTHRSHQHTEKLFEHTRSKDREQAELTREGQVTDRYVEASKLLASDNPTERLCGIHSFERIMRDSEKAHETVVSVLASFIRQRAPLEHPTKDVAPPADLMEIDEGRTVPADDVHAAVTALIHRPRRRERSKLNLSDCDLRDLDLRHAYLDGADLSGSRLDRADLKWASLSQANLCRTILNGADLVRADLD